MIKFDIIKSMYVKSLARERIEKGERELFEINSGVRRGCVVFSRLFII